MIISVGESGQCWICGKDNVEITRHHALPKYLKPIHNVIVPVCKCCHKRLNTEDINGMYSYLQVMKTKIKENISIVNRAFNTLDSLKKIRESSQNVQSKNINKASLGGKDGN